MARGVRIKALLAHRFIGAARAIRGLITGCLIVASFICILLPIRLAADPSARPATIPVTVVETRRYDPKLFTQGLELDGDTLLISSGGFGRSVVQRCSLDDLTVKARYQLAPAYFAEGLTRWDNRVYLLSWQAGKAWVLDRNTLQPVREFHYTGQGWGITHNRDSLIISDGTDTLSFVSPDDFRVRHSLKVTLNGQPLYQINELEYAHDRIWANLWHDNRIVRINPHTGLVDAILTLPPRITRYHQHNGENVLNGIAWDEQRQGFWITGKRWPEYFLIRPETGSFADF